MSVDSCPIRMVHLAESSQIGGALSHPNPARQ
jgi:hypothetical protein